MMTCADALDNLQILLDGQPITDPAAFDRHLAECAECQELFAATRPLIEGLRLLTPAAPPAGLAEKITTQVQQDRRAQKRHRFGFYGAAAVAASLLVAFSISCLTGSWTGQADAMALPYYDQLLSWFRPPPKPASIDFDNSVSKKTDQDLPPEEIPPPKVREGIADVGSAVVALARRAADDTVGQTRILIPDPMTGGNPEPVPDVDPAAKSIQEAGQNAASGLQPVTNSARRALGLFLREIPQIEPEPGK